MRISYLILYNSILMLNYKYIHKQEKLYKQVRKIYCNQLGVVVHFGNQGFRHLLRKYGKIRPSKDYTRRFILFRKYIKSLGQGEFKITTKIQERNNSRVCFLSLEKNFNDKKIIVILRRINDGKIHFFSIMDKK